MFSKVLIDLSAWFLLALIVGLLAGATISTFREAPSPGFSPFLETDWEAPEEKETLVLLHAGPASS
jgi:hypothetical protein